MLNLQDAIGYLPKGQQSYIYYPEYTWDSYFCCEFLRTRPVRDFSVAFISTENTKEWLQHFEKYGFKFELVQEQKIKPRSKEEARYLATLHNRAVLKIGDFVRARPGSVNCALSIYSIGEVRELCSDNRFIKAKPIKRIISGTDDWENVKSDYTLTIKATDYYLVDKNNLPIHSVEDEYLAYEYRVVTNNGISSLAHHTILRYLWAAPALVRGVLGSSLPFLDALYLWHRLEPTPAKGSILHPGTYFCPTEESFSRNAAFLLKGNGTIFAMCRAINYDSPAQKDYVAFMRSVGTNTEAIPDILKQT